jgi:hypothetical protein
MSSRIRISATETLFSLWFLWANGSARLLCLFPVLVGLCLPLCAEVGVGQSGFFTVNTRFSGGVGEFVSGAFAIDTTGAALRSAKVTGRVQDAVGGGLAGVVVLALQNNIVRAQTATDSAGNYTLGPLTPGTYLLRVEKPDYLTVLRYGVEIAAGQVA